MRPEVGQGSFYSCCGPHGSQQPARHAPCHSHWHSHVLFVMHGTKALTITHINNDFVTKLSLTLQLQA